MNTELSVILQNSPSLIQTGLDEDTLAVAGGALGNATKRISIRGGVFRKIVGGKEVSAIEDRHMNVIIVKMAHAASRTFYASSYKENEKVSPSCWSSDSRVPDADVKTPQAKSCDACPQSVKSGAGSSCRLSWRLAVVLPNDPAGDVMQLVLPSTSCWQKEDSGKWGFRPYIQMLASNNVSASRVVTKMQFDTKSPTPKVLFSPAAAVDPGDMDVVAKQAKSQAAEQAVKLTIFQPTEEGEAPQQAQATPAPAQAAPAEAQKSDVDSTEPVLRETTQAQPKPVNNVNDIVKKWSTKT